MSSQTRHALPLLGTLSLRGIWRKLRRRTWQFVKRIQTQLRGESRAGVNFRRSLISTIPDERALVHRIRKGPSPVFFIDDQKKEGTARQFRELCPGEEKNIIRAADLTCQHLFDLLGSGPCALGKEIDWQADFKSGRRWNQRAFYAGIHPTPYPGGADIKVPWELSRCQHFSWLGQAYWLSGDEAYAREFCAQVEHWVAHNPPQLGVNWVSSMDVGIRAVNWLWGYAYFRISPSLSDEFHLLFYQAMLEHGRHLFHNLEYSEILTSNHYLSDLVGLVYLGLLLPELKEAQVWRDFGLGELEREMFKQVYPDGIDFEASTNYHRLATELFLSATMLAQLNGFSFSPEYLTRLEGMVNVIGSITRPEGTSPVIGDQDNGRLHRLKVWENPGQEWVDFRPLVVAGAVWAQKPTHVRLADSDWAEAFWLVGPKAVRDFQQRAYRSGTTPVVSVLFPDGGWAVLGDHDLYLMMDVGSVGQNEQGGHAHNDSLSIDVSAGGQTWIVDPGTFVYTADYEARNAFRLTRAHNTLYFPGREQSQLDAKSPFRVELPSKTRVIHWETNDRLSLIVAEVKYAGLPVRSHRRAVLYAPETHGWLIADRVFPAGSEARIHLSLQPGVNAIGIEHPWPGIRLFDDFGKSLWVCSLQGQKPEITQSWVSNSYGRKQACLQAEFRFEGNPVHLWSLLPEQPGNELEARIRVLTKSWEDSSGVSWLES